MNSLERSLIEKAGYDNGWEIVLESVPEMVSLASALHRARASINPMQSGRGWRLTLPAGPLVDEMATAEAVSFLENGDFQAASDGELGRLLRHAARLARSLPDLPETRFAAAVRRELSQTITNTEVERLVRQRVGQDIYRSSLMDYWGSACAVTGVALPAILRASHARPWADCHSDAERLNVFNGFLLAAHLDALFDRKLISFDDAGQMLFSPIVTPQIRVVLGISAPLALRWISPGHLAFLEWHRDAFFRNLSSPQTHG